MKLDDIKRICEAATPGPWVRDGGDDIRHGTAYGPSILTGGGDETPTYTPDYDDACFIAMARTMLPKLVAVAEAARSVLSEDGVREQLACYVRGVDLIGALAALESNE